MNKIGSAAPPRAPRPPREWELQTLAVMAAVAAAAGLGILLLVGDLAIRSYLLSDGVNGMSGLVRWIAGHWGTIAGFYLLLGVAYLFGFLLWRKQTRDLLHSAGDPAGNAAEHWTVAAWYLAFAASFAIRFANDPASYGISDRPTWLAWDAAQTGVRLSRRWWPGRSGRRGWCRLTCQRKRRNQPQSGGSVDGCA